jgi:hypothetical protein
MTDITRLLENPLEATNNEQNCVLLLVKHVKSQIFPAFFVYYCSSNVGNVEPLDARMRNRISRTFLPYFFQIVFELVIHQTKLLSQIIVYVVIWEFGDTNYFENFAH